MSLIFWGRMLPLLFLFLFSVATPANSDTLKQNDAVTDADPQLVMEKSRKLTDAAETYSYVADRRNRRDLARDGQEVSYYARRLYRIAQRDPDQTEMEIAFDDIRFAYWRLYRNYRYSGDYDWRLELAFNNTTTAYQELSVAVTGEEDNGGR